jgi:ABC-type glycerol-3-phosphate transport system permease component
MSTIAPTQRRGLTSQKSRNTIREILFYLVLIVTIFVFAAPLLWIFSTSVKTTAEAMVFPPHWIPNTITFQAYWDLLFAPDATFLKYMRNSVIISFSATFLTLLFGTLAAYSISRYRIAGSGAVLLFILAMRMMPGITIIIPFFYMMQQFGLLDSKIGLILIYTVFNLPLVIWLMKGYFDTIPMEMEEAAKIDGCSRIGLFYKIALPLAGPGLGATAIFAFMGSWNEFMFNMILSTSENSKTLPVGVQQAVGMWSIRWEMLSTGAVLAALPVFIFAIAFQRYIVSGMTAGAVKG